MQEGKVVSLRIYVGVEGTGVESSENLIHAYDFVITKSLETGRRHDFVKTLSDTGGLSSCKLQSSVVEP